MKTLPKIVYHYTTIKNAISILSSGVFRFGLLCKSNDITESGYKGPYKYQSFTYAANSDIGATKPRMWAQYGGLNKGCCIEIDFEEYIAKNHIPLQNCFYVKYRSRAYFLKHMYNADDERLLRNKLDDWKEENEIRIISNNVDQYHIDGCIRYIHIGHDAEEKFPYEIIQNFKFKKMIKIGAVISDWGTWNEVVAEQYHNGGPINADDSVQQMV